MHALLIGATGATGKDLLGLLLQDDYFTSVTAFVRRPVDADHPKLTIHIINFDEPETWRQLVQGDVLFSALGTTLKAAGSKDAQWKIDYEHQYAFAKAARKAGVPAYMLVSAGYASPDSFLFYSKMKGKLEVAVRELGFRVLGIFRPPLLIRKGTDRSGEVLGARVLCLLNRLGLFKSARPMKTEILAKAMIAAAKTGAPGTASYENKQIRALAGDFS